MPRTLIIDDNIPEYMINDFKNTMEKELRRQLTFKMEAGLKIFLKAQKEVEKQQREADKREREAERDLKMTMTERKALRKARERQQMEEARQQIQGLQKLQKSKKSKKNTRILSQSPS